MSQNRLDYQAQLSRHSHDISGGYSSTLTTGPIVPQYFHILGPGDTIYFDTHMLVRMQDVITAFLGEIDFHIDAWFVPLQMMYTPFGQIYAQTDDFISSNFDADNIRPDSFPVVDVDAAVATHENNYKRFTYFKSECWGKECFRMLDAFNLNPLSVCSAAARTKSAYTGASVDDKYTHNLKITPWVPAAYQCIYQKGYRNDSLERLNVSSYNFDSEYANTDITTGRTRFFIERYAQRPNDYFTSMRVSPIASAINKVKSSHDSGLMANGEVIDYVDRINNFLNPGGSSFYAMGFGSDADSSADDAFKSVSVSSNFNVEDGGLGVSNVANIRSLFAVDKFMRIWGRADKTYDDQILAHFGVKIPHDVKHDVTRIKSWRFSLGSTPVYSTANSSGNSEEQLVGALGQVGGQGLAEFDSARSRDGFSEKFTAPVHGVFMIVAYAVTKPRYYNTFSRLHLLSNRLSFPIPEFDKLGAQPVYKFQISPFFLNQAISSQFCGWENRWHEFKEKYNRAAYTFSAQGTHFDAETTNVYAPWLISQPVFNDLFNEAVLTDDNNFVDRELFHERTDSVNPVLRRVYTAGWSPAYWSNPHEILQSDPFITEFMCRAKLVSWMSETGEPDL